MLAEKHRRLQRLVYLEKKDLPRRDPVTHVTGSWIVRRYGPGTGRIDLENHLSAEEATLLLRCMGWETANVHLGSAERAADVLHDLQQRPKRWLVSASKTMARAVNTDFAAFTAE